MTDKKVLERSMRSVFVGNIPYDTTEEKLKEVFSEVGPVVLIKLVYDKETGKPKGYGFCEYNDQETALSAMRNLNGFAIGGRSLRVDNACTEKSKLEMQTLMSGMPASENHFGEPVSAEEAPEVISNVVSNLPPERLYELMKQMKECVQNNPLEARNMLLQNPQLGYALLQAQVKMKIVDPEVAKTMLYPAHEVPSLSNVLNAVFTSKANSTSYLPGNNNQWKYTNPQMVSFHPNMHQMNRGPDININLRKPPNQVQFFSPQSMPVEPSQLFMGSRDYPQLSVPVPMALNNHSFGNTNLVTTSLMPLMNFPPPVLVSETNMSPRTFQIDQSQQLPSETSTDNDEKAALILQVMQLTDAQIAMLPNEQRQSILTLKEKISGTSLEKK